MSKRSASLLVSLANGLSLIRLFAVPGIVFLIWRSQGNEASRFAALWLIAALHAGDILDGYLARKGSRQLAVRNHFGEMIDPIADKLYVGAAFVTLALAGQFHAWFAGLVVVRDLSIITGWSWIYKRFGIRLLPNRPGKVTDGALVTLLCIVLLRPPAAALDILTPIAAALVLVSGYLYARMAAGVAAQASFRRLRASVRAARAASGRAARDGVRSPS